MQDCTKRESLRYYAKGESLIEELLTEHRIPREKWQSIPIYKTEDEKGKLIRYILIPCGDYKGEKCIKSIKLPY
ncbi:hypothetical protein HZB88_02625 [archaeon]|nr:hypothetical protein [archaeon]